MKTTKRFLGLVVLCAMLCLSVSASADEDPTETPELFDGSRLGVSCSVVDTQDTDDGTETAE
jgi:hypothetical protein